MNSFQQLQNSFWVLGTWASHPWANPKWKEVYFIDDAINFVGFEFAEPCWPVLQKSGINVSFAPESEWGTF